MQQHTIVDFAEASWLLCLLLLLLLDIWLCQFMFWWAFFLFLQLFLYELLKQYISITITSYTHDKCKVLHLLYCVYQVTSI